MTSTTPPLALPRGFRFAGVHCGIKQASDTEDFTLVASDHDTVAAGVFTTNVFKAASVVYNRALTPSSQIRAVAVNSGNANACTGELGMKNARRMASLAARALDVESDQVLVMSTGIIGHQLPMDCIEAGTTAAAGSLSVEPEAFHAAARGITTTDTVTKTASRSVKLSCGDFTIAGMAKGAGMIGPNMATMLAVVVTDAPLDEASAQRLLSQVAAHSFNAISVEGHMSTNDTLLLLANGRAAASAEGRMVPALDEADVELFRGVLGSVCEELARAIVADGEGATHVVTIDVEGADDDISADRIAREIADSALVKTAIFGNDPNWGRIVSAAGQANISFSPELFELRINGTLVFVGGTPADFDADAVSKSMAADRDVVISIRLGQGDGWARHWTCDLTYDYVRINAEYHT